MQMRLLSKTNAMEIIKQQNIKVLTKSLYFFVGKWMNKFAKYENAKPLHNKQWFKGLGWEKATIFFRFSSMHVQVKKL